jgi:uncharacterized protein YjeT (DUF2065 family)
MGLEHVMAGVAVVLAVEGLLYAIAPAAMRRAIGQLAAQPEGRLQVAGLAAAALGIAVAWVLTRA